MSEHPPAAPPRPRRSKTLLLTIIGSVAVPESLTLWQETYVRGLTELGVAEAAARQAIVRAIASGWLARERVGRRTRLHVVDEHRDGIVAASNRVAEFGQPFDWNGEWLLVSLRVPEQARRIRHHFRTEFGWLGFGSLGNGLWISPHTENEAATLRLLDRVEGLGDAYVFRSARIVGMDPEELAATAWDMRALRTRYDAFLERFSDAAPSTDQEFWAEWIALTTSWRHFPLFDPELPEHLLPADWPRAAAFRLFHRSDARWGRRAIDHLLTIEREIG